VSHELRNPLSPVLMTAATLERDAALPQPVREQMKQVRDNVELEVRLIDDLVDLNRIKAGKLVIRPETVDAHALIEDVVRICAGDIAGKRHKLEMELAAEAHHVAADPIRLRQVIWNL